MDEATDRKYEQVALKLFEGFQYSSMVNNDLEAIRKALRAAYADGLKYAAIIARERGKPHDIDWWHNSSKREISRRTAIDLAELIEQHAKEMGHE